MTENELLIQTADALSLSKVHARKLLHFIYFPALKETEGSLKKSCSCGQHL